MTFYHASAAQFAPGDEVRAGYPANFASAPMGLVFLTDNLASAEYWQEFLGGESMAEKLGYWPDVFIYEVEPRGALEPDPWCEYYEVPGCYQTTGALAIRGRVA